jgi:hypothetical protein
MRLRRIAIGPVLLDRLPAGKSRKLSAAELTNLQRILQKRAKPGENEPAVAPNVEHAES